MPSEHDREHALRQQSQRAPRGTWADFEKLQYRVCGLPAAGCVRAQLQAGNRVLHIPVRKRTDHLVRVGLGQLAIARRGGGALTHRDTAAFVRATVQINTVPLASPE